MLSNQPFYKKALHRTDHAFLFLHGLGGGIYELALIADHLHARDYSVVGINYPGHDEPSRRMPHSTWEQWYERVEEAYLDLAASHDNVSVVGFSTGCMLALHLAANHSIHRQVLLSPFLKIKHEWYYLAPPEKYITSRLGKLIADVPRRRLPIKDPDMHVHANRAAYFKTFNLGAVRSALDLIRLVDTELDRVTVPTLIIMSRRDSIVCPTGADILMQRLPSPCKEIVWLSDSDHVISLDVERDLVTRQIERFLCMPAP